jgi:predicted RNA-binding protein YlqC (UPF0109 family)
MNSDNKEETGIMIELYSSPDCRMANVAENVYAKNDDIARLIGRRGSMASALRQVMSVASHTDDKKVTIKFEEIE